MTSRTCSAAGRGRRATRSRMGPPPADPPPRRPRRPRCSVRGPSRGRRPCRSWEWWRRRASPSRWGSCWGSRWGSRWPGARATGWGSAGPRGPPYRSARAGGCGTGGRAAPRGRRLQQQQQQQQYGISTRRGVGSNAARGSRVD